MAVTPKIGLTYLETGQTGAETRVNGWINNLESIAQLSFIDRDLTAPPGSPSDGDVYLVASTASGDWLSQDGKIAIYFSGWSFVAVSEGMRAWVEDENAWIMYDGSKWAVYEGPVVTLTDAASISWDMATGPVAQVTLGGNRTLNTPTNIDNGRVYSLLVIQDGTGSRTITWPSEVKWPGGTAPTLSTGANDVDLVSFVARSGNLYGTYALDFS
jgi:hypothetical protein